MFFLPGRTTLKQVMAVLVLEPTDLAVFLQPVSKAGIQHICIKLLAGVLNVFVLGVRIPDKTGKSL